MKKYYLIFLSIFTLFSCSSNVDEAEVKKAQQFFESVFQDQVLDSPEFQASLGFKSNYDKWDDITWQASRKRAYRAKDDLDYLEKNIDFDKLDENTKISYRLMEKRLQRAIDNDKFIFHGYMITHRGGKHSSIPSCRREMACTGASKARVHEYALKRVRRIAAVLACAHATVCLRLGIRYWSDRGSLGRRERGARARLGQDGLQT